METRFNMFDNDFGGNISKRFYNMSLLIEGSTLPKSLRELVSIRVSQINGCGFCVDIHTKEAAVAGESTLRINLVTAWRHATAFTEAERAALALAEEGTRIADASGGVSDETWDAVRKHYDDDQIAALVSVIALCNASNRFGVILNSQGGAYEPAQFASLAS